MDFEFTNPIFNKKYKSTFIFLPAGGIIRLFQKKWKISKSMGRYFRAATHPQKSLINQDIWTNILFILCSQMYGYFNTAWSRHAIKGQDDLEKPCTCACMSFGTTIFFVFHIHGLLYGPNARDCLIYFTISIYLVTKLDTDMQTRQ